VGEGKSGAELSKGIVCPCEDFEDDDEPKQKGGRPGSACFGFFEVFF